MEWTNIYEALIITAGVIVAQVAISWRSNNVILYRLDVLERKQDKHNSLIERMICVEQAIEDGERRLNHLEKKVGQ